jgi:hypothetical protein
MHSRYRIVILTIAILSVTLDSNAQVTAEGKYLILNGVDQHMVIKNHPDFNIVAGESYTMTFRIWQADFAATSRVISKGNSYMPGSRYEFCVYNSAQKPNFGLNLYNAENRSLGATYVSALNAGVWIHIGWVYHSEEKASKIYINGQLFSSVTSSHIGKDKIENTFDLIVGCGITDPEDPVKYQFWRGNIDELRIWKRALSSLEIAADQTASKPNFYGLAAAYDFEKIAGATVPDISGNGHGGHLLGYGIRMVHTELPVGIGETDERLCGFRLISDPFPETLTGITISLLGTTDIADVSQIKLYHTGTSERTNLRKARLLESITPTKYKSTFTGNWSLIPGENYFWIAVDISPGAKEGNTVTGSVVSYNTSSSTLFSLPEDKGSRPIILGHRLLFSGGDAGSKYHRIPAIVTARDGSLITATDRRWDYPNDLPNHIDLVIRRSSDKGQTWSDALTLYGEGTETGFGDAALVVNQKSGTIICLFAGNRGFFSSSSASLIRIYQSKSRDNGLTWSSPTDITDHIYGPGCLNPITQGWQGAFVTSGAATQLRNGRLMAGLVVRENTSRSISSYVIYSDDNARTWQVSSGRASSEGNESKIVELNDGNLLMSIRSNQNRKFNLSRDKGMTWSSPFSQPAIQDPNCNGDLIRYTSMTDGYLKNRLLHSIPYATNRSNLSVLLSYDEGETWPVRKTVYPGKSAYSSLTVLQDGTIGMYYEVGEYETYEMYFARFSLGWLTNGADRRIDVLAKGLNPSPWLEQEQPVFTLYPNPAENQVNISGITQKNTLIEIFNTQGQLVSRTQFEEAPYTAQISLQNFVSGMYFVKIAGTVMKLSVK